MSTSWVDVRRITAPYRLLRRRPSLPSSSSSSPFPLASSSSSRGHVRPARATVDGVTSAVRHRRTSARLGDDGVATSPSSSLDSEASSSPLLHGEGQLNNMQPARGSPSSSPPLSPSRRRILTGLLASGGSSLALAPPRPLLPAARADDLFCGYYQVETLNPEPYKPSALYLKLPGLGFRV